MNIWKDISKERVTPTDFIACIEISKGTKNKYELDKETGMMRLDRVLYTSTIYPMNYGFIPRTYSGDDDPLDVFVLCSEPILSSSLVRCYPIGIIKMFDRNETDEKIIAIPFGDPQYNNFKDVSELPEHIFDELKHFLTVYKQLENKNVEVHEILGFNEAQKSIKTAIEYFNNKFDK